MPDNRDSGLDPSFIDAAWEDMQRQLDEAMPVESKSKRRVIAWWWWAAGWLLPIAAVVWFAVQKDQPVLAALPIDLQGKSLPQEAPKQEAVAVIGDKTSNAATVEINKAPSPPTPTPTPAQTELPSMAPVHSTKSPKENLSIIDIATTTTPQTPIPNVKKLENTIKPSKEAVTTSAPNTQPTPDVDRQLLPLVAPVASLSLTDIPAKELAWEGEIMTNTRLSNWALELGATTRSFVGVDGLFVGLGKEWGKSNRKWSFGAGMQYRFQRLPFDNQNLSGINVSKNRSASTVEDALSFGQDPGMEAVLDTDNNVINFASADSVISVPVNELKLIQKLHYIDIPLYANFKFRPKWQLFMGVQFSFLAKAYLDIAESRLGRELDLAASYNSVAAGSRVNWYANRGNTRIGVNTGDFQRLQMGISTGITYYPRTKLGIRLQYKSTPISVYKAAGISTYDHWLGTSVLWRFGGK